VGFSIILAENPLITGNKHPRHAVAATTTAPHRRHAGASKRENYAAS